MSAPKPDQTANGPIDAVITWVDGNSDRHRHERRKYQAQETAQLHANAINPHRWLASDEIRFCLQSINNHAPWLRYVWIVVDCETPDLSDLPDALRAKIRIAYHHDIFSPFADALPTFNSLAIESLLWRIDGLSERFLYFNDDVFLTAPLQPSDVFDGDRPVLRGRWADFSALANQPEQQKDPALFHHVMQINAARLAGFDAGHLFAAAHVVHPLRRTVMARLFDDHRPAFLANIHHRFRDLSQFLPQGLHNHTCIAAKQARLQTHVDHCHIKSGQGQGTNLPETRVALRRALRPDIKFLCVNDLPQLERGVPEARQWLHRAIGGFAGAKSGVRR